jgi:hypothetical protein
LLVVVGAFKLGCGHRRPFLTAAFRAQCLFLSGRPRILVGRPVMRGSFRDFTLYGSIPSDMEPPNSLKSVSNQSMLRMACCSFLLTPYVSSGATGIGTVSFWEIIHCSGSGVQSRMHRERAFRENLPTEIQPCFRGLMPFSGSINGQAIVPTEIRTGLVLV